MLSFIPNRNRGNNI